MVEANPYPVTDPTKVVVAFLGEEVEQGQLGLGDLGAYLPDELTLVGREVYVSVPNGQARSKLMEALTKRRMPTTVTVRNWRTVTALAERCARERMSDRSRTSRRWRARRRVVSDFSPDTRSSVSPASGCDRRPPVAAEGARAQLDAGRRLAALVLGPVDEPERRLDHRGVEVRLELLA